MIDKERKLAEEMLLKHTQDIFIFPYDFPDEKVKKIRTAIISAMKEYAQQSIKSLAPTDEEINNEADKYCLIDDEDEPGEKRNDAEAFEHFRAGMFRMREKLTGVLIDREEKQKGAPFDEEKTMM